jgi:hypothetical protein
MRSLLKPRSKNQKEKGDTTMILDNTYAFGIPALTDNTRTVSPTVLDLGSAKVLFGGAAGSMKVKYRAAISSATSAGGLLVELIGADNAALTSNPLNLGSSGINYYNPAGTAIGDAGTVEGEFAVSSQHIAKQHYGLMVTAFGTSPTVVGSVLAPTTDHAHVVLDAQTNMVGGRAAVP